MEDSNPVEPEDHRSSPESLPNGLKVFGLNKHETDFMYREVFEEQVYLKHGIQLSEHPVVIDIGANIGMFSLFIKSLAPTALIYAFEPAPELFRLLQKNLVDHFDTVRLFQKGISAEEGTAEFVFYPDYSIMSGFHTDLEKDSAILSEGIKNQLRAQNPTLLEKTQNRIERMADQKLERKVSVTTQITTLSRALEELPPSSAIDLVKVDAEGAEVGILSGVLPNDWNRISQVVMEVHGSEQTESVVRTLDRQGFDVVVDQEDQFADSMVSNVFARRVS